MRTIIVGGGIGGLTTALAMKRMGLSFDVYEAAKAWKPVGAGIWVPVNAMQVLARLGVAEQILTRGVALDSVVLTSGLKHQGTPISFEAVKRRFGFATVAIRRADLHHILLEAVTDQAKESSIHLGKRCLGVSQSEDKVTLTFEDGEHVEADLLIGADGIRSDVRERACTKVTHRYSGQTCWRGLSSFPWEESLPPRTLERWHGNKRFGYSPVAPGLVYWFAVDKALPNGVDVPNQRGSDLLARFCDFPDPVLPLIQATKEDEMIRGDLGDFKPLTRWHWGRIALLGDAAHGMTPNMGQGGAQAIEDAYVLAQSLVQCPDFKEALRRYQRLRLKKARYLVRDSWRMGRLAQWSHPITCAIRHLMVTRMPRRLAERALAKSFKLNY